MPTRPRITTILPCTNLASATCFFLRLGFNAPSKDEMNEWDQYLMLDHPNGSEIHLREIGPDEEGWLEPHKNSFGIYVYSEDVEALAMEFANEIIEQGKKPEIKEWGLLEFSLNGPDGCLVRVGWPVGDIEMGKRKVGEKSE
ncbi:hypothetical protein P152DRAFT_454159 [Eremomyces bilateralis CBS 781.70]|uniref:Glyoxalase/Bleomycin resistance protein/Dihydroxybiphenyl dioxygenase n=1 Tax=Eremomyces bilateralis CBS 781.70 TaxID=1392243 RepID=A0A6G1GHK3_9PEZI|nr:uncharacterized protein P152DRAFT_454159 [Eremomyces bilateralis CBS 781.70]KAF1817577.1 hypothetical protein P152DRAFT_454159 [Eremomyces bilateralis CBS 781.70]